MVVVDSSVWIDYMRNTMSWQADWLNGKMDHPDIGLIDIILCEVLQGIETDREFRQVRHGLKRFHVLESGGEEVAVEAARHYRTLRGYGITVRKTIDCMIATICISGGHTLLHRDRDFDGFEKHLGLSVVQSLLH